MQTVFERNVFMRRKSLYYARHKLLPHDCRSIHCARKKYLVTAFDSTVHYGTDSVPAFPVVFHYTTNKLFHEFHFRPCK